MSRYTQNLYDVGAFLDRNIPTRNEFFNMVGSPKPAVPEGVPYEQRLRAAFPQIINAMPGKEEYAAALQSAVPMQIPAGMRAPARQFPLDQAGAWMYENSMPNQAPAAGGNITDADTMFPNSAPSTSKFGAALGTPEHDSAPRAGLENQIQNINNQTVQSATGKAQEAETMSDLQKMVRAYFGGRTQEQKQKEAFMNIAAGLASGKSPRFLDNLGGAVSGAITFGRDDTNRREKEALAGMIDVQKLDDTRNNNAEENAIRREANDIDRTKVGAATNQSKLYASYYATAARQARAARDKIDPSINPEAYALYDKQVNDAEAAYMAAVASGGGGGSFMPPSQSAPSADIVYEKVGKGFKQAGEK